MIQAQSEKRRLATPDSARLATMDGCFTRTHSNVAEQFYVRESVTC